jgi:predicted AlkP superfamily pyrophosphatase or phosphodiesterase
MYLSEEKNYLLRTINSMRKELIQIGIKEGLGSENTIAISQKLDEYIAKYQAI